jgi:two-component system cell cycle sensor histidine kinase/response regulator CckA
MFARDITVSQPNSHHPVTAACQTGPIGIQSMEKWGSTTVLIVDDDDRLRRLCCDLLAANGFQVLEADNAMEALLIAAQHCGAIGLVIADLAMHRVPGAQLGRAFKEIWPRTNVLYLSVTPREAIGESLPPDSPFLQKGCIAEELLQTVQAVIR